MAVSRVGSTSGVNTATLPAHQAGDLIVVFTFTDGSATIPTLVAGYTSIGTTTVTTIVGGRIAYKYATSSSETLGTWTSATALIAHVYRGATLSPGVGTAGIQGSNNSAYAYGPLTMYGPGTSWVLGFLAHANTDTTLTNMAKGPWAGNTVVNYSDATNKAVSFDTNGAVPGWPTINSTTVGGTAGGWINGFLEICDATAVLSTPVARAQTGSLAATHTTASFTPLANETLFVAVSATHGTVVPAQPTISDSASLTWTEIDDTQYNTGSAPWWRQRLFWANVGGSPVSMTITGASASATGVYVNAVSMSGVDTTALANKASNTNAAGDPSTTLPSQPHPLSTTLVFACGTGGLTATLAGYTELFDGAPQSSRWLYAAYDPTVPTIGAHAIASTNTFSISCEVEAKPANLPNLAFRALVNPTAVASGNLVFTEPTGTAQGDLLVATITYRDTPQFTMPSGWTQVAQNSTGADVTASNGTPGALMAYIVRGASAPDLTFVRTAGDVAFGTLAAYTPKTLTGTITYDTVSAVTRQTTTAAISFPGFTTAQANELVVGFSGSGRALGAPEYELWKAATSPSWFSERSDIVTATGADASHSHFDAIAASAGATGTITGTCVATNAGNISMAAGFYLAAAGPAAVNLSASQLVVVSQSAALSVPANLSASQAIDVTQAANVVTIAPAANLSAGQAIIVSQSAQLQTEQRLSASQPITVTQTANLSVPASLSTSQTITVLQSAVLSNPVNLSATQPIVVAQSASVFTIMPPANLSATQPVTVTQTANLSASIDLSANQPIVVSQTALLSVPANLSATQAITVTQQATLAQQVTGQDLFSDETGAFPSGWTQRYSTATTTITGQSAAPGVAQIVSTTAGGRRALSFDQVPVTGDIEVMTSASTSVIGTSQTLMGTFICGASPGSANNTNRETQYLAGFTVTAGGVVQYILKRYADNGTSSTITDIQAPTNVVNFTVAATTLYRIRLRKSGSTVMMRAWPDGGAEPGTWDLSGTDGTPLAGGWAGLFYFPAATGKFDFFTYGTNGAAAPEPVIPTSNLSASQPIVVSQSGTIQTIAAAANLSATQAITVTQQAAVSVSLDLSASQPIAVTQSANLQTLTAPSNLSASQPIVIGQTTQVFSSERSLAASQPIVIGQFANLQLTPISNITANQLIVVGQTAQLSVSQRLSASQPITVTQQGLLSAGHPLTASQPIVIGQQAFILSVVNRLNALQPIVIGQNATLKRTALGGQPIPLVGLLDDASMVGSLEPIEGLQGDLGQPEPELLGDV